MYTLPLNTVGTGKCTAEPTVVAKLPLLYFSTRVRVPLTLVGTAL
jgi:hypothetical protein